MTPWLVRAGLCGAPAPAPTPADARAGRAMLSPHWWCVRVSCAVTTPCGPRLWSTASGGLWSVAWQVVRRALYVALIVASAVATKHTQHSRAPERRRGFRWMLHTHIACVQFRTGAVRASLTHPCRVSPRDVWRMLHRCVLCFGALCLSPCLPSRAVSVRVACSLRCALKVASPRACCALQFASLHVSSVLVTSAHCMHVASFHRYIGNAQPSLWRTAVWHVVRRAMRALTD
jgi:hypothetical protein